RNHLVVGPDGFLAPLAHQPPPAEHQARREPVTASNVADRHAGLHRLGNDGELQLGGKASPASDAGDHFNLRERIGHRRIPRLMPRSSGYRPCPVETGCPSADPLAAIATPRRRPHSVTGVAVIAALALSAPAWAQPANPSGGNAMGLPGPNPGGPGLTPYSS